MCATTLMRLFNDPLKDNKAYQWGIIVFLQELKTSIIPISFIEKYY